MVGSDQRAGGKTADRLYDEGEYRLGALTSDRVFKGGGADARITVGIVVRRQTIGERRRDLRHQWHQRRENIFRLRITGHRSGTERRAMVAGVAPDHLPACRFTLRDRVLAG